MIDHANGNSRGANEAWKPAHHVQCWTDAGRVRIKIDTLELSLSAAAARQLGRALEAQADALAPDAPVPEVG